MRWAVLVGGTGSNLRAILESGFSVALVVSHREGVGALDIAAQHRVPSRVVSKRDFPERDAFDAELRRQLAEHAIDRVAMAGFLRWLTPATIEQFPGAILNLHPSLLPAFPGLHAIERAYQAGVPWSGVSVHFVDEGQDTGPVVAQIPVPRLPQDSLEEFRMRIQAAEHRLYPRVLRAIEQGEAELQDGRVVYHTKGDTAWMHGHS